MRGLEKNRMEKGQTDRHMNGHRDSMNESAKGRFFENLFKSYGHVIGGFFLAGGGSGNFLLVAPQTHPPPPKVCEIPIRGDPYSGTFVHFINPRVLPA